MLVVHLGWVKVTHVCRRWRQVALDYDLLWRRIPSVPVTEWTFRFIERSGATPLVFALQDNFWQYNSPWDVLRQEIHRLGELHLLGKRAIAQMSRVVDDLKPLEGLPMHVLDIHARNDGPPGEQEGTTFLPGDFLAGLNASLHRPHLQRAFDTEHGLLVGMLATLKANPDLEHLLVDCLPPTILSSDIVNLPRLQSIKIGVSIVACAQTMRHIAIPSSARTHFSCLYDEQDAPHAPLLRLVGERLAPSGTGKSVKICTLMVKCGGIYSPLCDDHFGPPDVVLTLPTNTTHAS
ncbi:hypothetical protein FA95DRAFT_1605124 [Auriscalpium vulgare]|uniref:Uncharacterized protein n=1 Tax=Auriscalpium vulgare TaxID=40419 RepID=A0ACB8RWT8_9AGAM|nr:hypothetical protein FA95DRAFT_1605124 [Auriscalpium vulgare]